MIASQLTGESDYLSGVYKYVNIIMYKVIDINLTNSYNDYDTATKMSNLQIQNIHINFTNVMLGIISQ